MTVNRHRRVRLARPRRGAAQRTRLQAIREAEARVEPGQLRAASRVYDSLSREEQLAIAREIVVTRATDFYHLYPNTVSVSFGYRRRVDRVQKRHRVLPRPCVRFLVEGKWNERGRKGGPAHRSALRRIPQRLVAFATIGGQRALCAVPTDVEDVDPYLQVSGHGTAVALAWDGKPESGALACAIRRNTVPERLYAVSACHVLSLSEWNIAEPTWGTEVHVGGLTSETIVGPTRAVAGDLEGPVPFDAQLLEVTKPSALEAAIGASRPKRYATDVGALPCTADYLSDNHPAGRPAGDLRGLERLRVRRRRPTHQTCKPCSEPAARRNHGR